MINTEEAWDTYVNRLPMPVTCMCGFSTMNAAEAVRHIKEKHPELWEEGEVGDQTQKEV